MQQLFVGLILVWLNLEVEIGSIYIGLLPSFVGYILINKGSIQLAAYCDHFQRIAQYVKGMALYTGIIYCMDLTGITELLGGRGNFLTLILSIISTICALFVSFRIVFAMQQIESTQNQDFSVNRLYSAWKLLALFSVILYPFYFTMLFVVCFIVYAGAAICFLVRFHQTKALFEVQNAPGMYDKE